MNKDETSKHRAHALFWGMNHYDWELCEYLILNGVDNYVVNEQGLAPIHHASKRGYDKLVELLVKFGADYNLHSGASIPKDTSGFSPLHFSCRYGHLEITKYLISVGANVNSVSKAGETPIFFAIKTLPYYSYSGSGNLDCVNELIKAGADIEHCDNQGWNPLYTASRVDDKDAIGVLIAAGANQACLRVSDPVMGDKDFGAGLFEGIKVEIVGKVKHESEWSVH